MTKKERADLATIRAALEQATGGRPSNIAAAQEALAALAALETEVAGLRSSEAAFKRDNDQLRAQLAEYEAESATLTVGSKWPKGL